MYRQRGWVRSARWAGAICTTLFSSRSAGAATAPTVRLDYSAEQGIDGCFDEPTFRDAVRTRLSFDPFTPASDARPLEVTATIAHSGSKLRASIVLADGASQEILAGTTECATLTVATALAVAMTIERSIAERRNDEMPAPPKPTPRRFVAPTRPPSAERTHVRSWTHAGVLLGAGILPQPSVGATVGAAVEVQRWISAGIELGRWLPSDVASPNGGGARASLLFITAKGCARRSALFACALATAGDFRATGTDLFVSRSSGSLYAAVGLRAGAEVPVARWFTIALEAGGVIPLVQRTLRIADEVLWTAPAVAAELGLHWRVTIF